jgi:guanyl-specific ribonuclease Sa
MIAACPAHGVRMRRLPGKPWLWLLALAMLLGWLFWPRPVASPAAPDAVGGATSTEVLTPTPAALALPAFLPAEARPVIARILAGGPHPHPQDGSTFGNREGLLPDRPRGHYREYTVPTPGLGHRGMRRIVTGGTPPADWYYTDDHYDSFRRFEVSQ